MPAHLPRLLLSACLALAIALPVAAVETPLPPAVDAIRVALRSNDVDAAVEAGQRAVETLKDSALAWWWAGRAFGQQAMRANILMRAKWAGRTREAFERAVSLDPKQVEPRLDLLNYYLLAPGFMGGGRDKAEVQVRAIADLDAAMGKVAEARMVAADDDAAQAEALYRQALTLDPDNGPARMSLAAYASERKDWAAARALWRDALEHGHDAATAHYQLGRLGSISGEDLDDALAHLDRFIADGVEPDGMPLAAAYWRRGQLLDKLGRRDEAIASLQRAVADPQVRELAESDLERLQP